MLIRELPSDTTEENIASLFDNSFRDEVLSVEFAFDTPALEKHLHLRKTVGLRLEEAHAILAAKDKRKTARTCHPCYLCGKKVDAIEFFKRRYDEESVIVNTKIEKVPHVAKHRTGVAFVTFRNVQSAKKAMQTRLAPIVTWNPLSKPFQVDPAPHPQDVYWTALNTAHLNRFVRR